MTEDYVSGSASTSRYTSPLRLMCTRTLMIRTFIRSGSSSMNSSSPFSNRYSVSRAASRRPFFGRKGVGLVDVSLHRVPPVYSYLSASAIGMLDACREGISVVATDTTNTSSAMIPICSHGT